MVYFTGWQTPSRCQFLGACVALMMSACATAPKITAPPPAPVVNPPIAPVAVAAPKPVAKPKLAVAKRPPPKDTQVLELALPDAEVGYYMDVLHARLQQVCGSRVGVARQGSAVVLRFAAPAMDSTAVTPLSSNMVDVLSVLAGVFKEYRRTQVIIQVYADDLVSPITTVSTAQTRSHAIMKYLVDSGVARQRLWVEPWTGNTRSPFAPPSERGTDVYVRLAPLTQALAVQ
jgi:outer membrane protein OmpA-like peptidoglycan-associated protein